MSTHNEHTSKGLSRLGDGISWLGFWLFLGATVDSCNYKQAVTKQETGAIQEAIEVFAKEDEVQSND